MDESKIWMKINAETWQWPGINGYSLIHYKSRTIGPKLQTSGVNPDHPKKATSHFQYEGKNTKDSPL